MTDKKPSDPGELTELEPLDPADLPELPELDELPELPELPEVEELPELPERTVPAASKPAPSKPAPVATPAQPAKPAPKPAPAPASAAKPAPFVPPAKPAPPTPEPTRSAPAPATIALSGESKSEAPIAPAPITPITPGAAAETEPSSSAGPFGADASGGLDAPASESAPAPSFAPGEKPPLRQLDKAPLHLKKAAVLVCAGSLAPWMGYEAGVLTYVVAKLVVLAGAWFWLKQIDHNWGPKLGGFLGKLGDLELAPKKKDDATKARKSAALSERPAVLTHTFPTGLHILSLVFMIAGAIALPFVDGLGGGALGKSIAELGMLAWAAYTYVHIHSYERWGAFNPIFPMMFLAMLLGGFLMVAGGLAAEPPLRFAMVGGGLVVGIGGGLAAYTIVEAMMQAKKVGDAKKAAALEARRQARKSPK